MEALKSDIATGISGLKFFDECSLHFPCLDIPVLAEVAKAVGLAELVTSDWLTHKEFWERYFHDGTKQDGRGEIHAKAQLLGASLARVYQSGIERNTHTFRVEVQQAIRSVSSQVAHTDLKVTPDILNLISARLDKLINILSQNSDFRAAMEVARVEAQGNATYDFLFVVATDVERDAVFTAVRELGAKPEPRFGGGRAYFDCGYIHGHRVALVKVAMGSVSVGGSVSTTMQVNAHLKPKNVIMVGIAFGMDHENQPIGTVLVSRQLQGYELQRVGTNEQGEATVTLRGPRTDASPKLVSLLEAAAGVWDDASVEFGLLLSGEKLIDNKDFRDQLKKLTGGEAIGGEMEGIGLVVAIAEKPTHWVIVKGVCDWADGNKSEDKTKRQTLAAKNAVSLVFRALKIVPDSEGH